MLARFRRFLADGRLSLPEPERSVLRQRYQEGLSVREVARDQGVSPATVLRIEKRALNVLRAGFLAAESR
jgi:RNA polymerase sigma factor (sigma-70 family)